MTKRYNANKNRWYAMLLCSVPYPLPWEEDEVDRKRKVQQSRAELIAVMSAVGEVPYFIYDRW